jgi:hypothetical protein
VAAAARDDRDPVAVDRDRAGIVAAARRVDEAGVA